MPGFSLPPTLHLSTSAFRWLSVLGSQRSGSWEMYFLDIQSSEKWAGQSQTSTDQRLWWPVMGILGRDFLALNPSFLLTS